MSELKQNKGAIISAAIQKERSILRYYTSPGHCLFCKRIIEVNNQKVSDVKRKKFCNKRCAAKFNSKFIKRAEKRFNCVICGEFLERKRSPSGGLSRPMYCKSCLVIVRNGKSIIYKTKGDVFGGRLNWQSARSCIRRHAQLVYEKSGKPRCCYVCGYENHFEVCHKKSVSSFPENVLILEINSIENLVALCPNHHWEVDNGILVLEDISRDRLEAGTSGGS